MEMEIDIFYFGVFDSGFMVYPKDNQLFDFDKFYKDRDTKNYDWVLSIKKENNMVVCSYVRYGLAPKSGRGGSLFGISIVFKNKVIDDFEELLKLFRDRFDAMLYKEDGYLLAQRDGKICLNQSSLYIIPDQYFQDRNKVIRDFLKDKPCFTIKNDLKAQEPAIGVSDESNAEAMKQNFLESGNILIAPNFEIVTVTDIKKLKEHIKKLKEHIKKLEEHIKKLEIETKEQKQTIFNVNSEKDYKELLTTHGNLQESYNALKTEFDKIKIPPKDITRTKNTSHFKEFFRKAKKVYPLIFKAILGLLIIALFVHFVPTIIDFVTTDNITEEETITPPTTPGLREGSEGVGGSQESSLTPVDKREEDKYVFRNKDEDIYKLKIKDFLSWARDKSSKAKDGIENIDEFEDVLNEFLKQSKLKPDTYTAKDALDYNKKSKFLITKHIKHNLQYQKDTTTQIYDTTKIIKKAMFFDNEYWKNAIRGNDRNTKAVLSFVLWKKQ